ncbi:S-adenosyl-L-methionine-dependent methyltransferase [Gaertneriomyces semiglobifer]|nr:S-adenosyl-L-methionine-dependent methyltransferase [Gaertneriomyces semiglobifer]
MPAFLIHFAHFHMDFRLQELESLAVYENVPLSFDAAEYQNNHPFLIVDLPSKEIAAKLVRRAILVRAVYELWGSAPSYDDLVSKIKECYQETYKPYDGTTWKFIVESFGKSLKPDQQLERIHKFAFLPVNGGVTLADPQTTFAILEDHSDAVRRESEGTPRMVYMGVLVGTGERHAVAKYNLKKREYLGTTSMDAELSLVMANMALAGPGKMVLDPFVGTGSMLVTCAHFGSYTMGADINGLQIRGKGKSNIQSNVRQYGLGGHVLDNVVCDIAHHPWRDGEWFDAIVTDPPYGVRAGAKMIGTANSHVRTRSNPCISLNPTYPQTVPYEMEQIMIDLVDFAARYLTVGGRLVYWLPTLPDEYTPEDLPLHPSMRLVADSEQNFGRWSRRLITMEKTKAYAGPLRESIFWKGEVNGSDKEEEKSLPAHSLFRARYFKVVHNTVLGNTQNPSGDVREDDGSPSVVEESIVAADER